jgi:hypothetical protein
MPSSSPQMHCTPRPFHSSWFDHPNIIWWAVQIIMQFSSLPSYLVPLKSKYLPQHPIRPIYNFTIDQYYIISHLFPIHVLCTNNPVTQYDKTYMIQCEKYIGIFLGI